MPGVGGWERVGEGEEVASGEHTVEEAEETGPQQGDGCCGLVGSVEGSEWRQGFGPGGDGALRSNSWEPFLKRACG